MPEEFTLMQITDILLKRNDPGVDELRIKFHTSFNTPEQKVRWMHLPNSYFKQFDPGLEGSTPIAAVLAGKASVVLQVLDYEMRADPLFRAKLSRK